MQISSFKINYTWYNTNIILKLLNEYNKINESDNY